MKAQHSVNRREFVKVAATAAVVAVGGPSASLAAKEEFESGNLIDVNVTLGRWPFRRLPLDETPALVAKLRHNGVKQAWVGTFDGLFYKDIAAANAWLAGECHRHGRGLLTPFGSINPTLPDWEDHFHRCAEIHHMAGIRLHPNYHGYKLDDPVFARLLCAGAGTAIHRSNRRRNGRRTHTEPAGPRAAHRLRTVALVAQDPAGCACDVVELVPRRGIATSQTTGRGGRLS